MLVPSSTPHAPRIVRGKPPPAMALRGAAQELRATLQAAPPTIAPKYLYDARGCAPADITELPEYHLPRVERAILDRHQADMLRLLPQDAELIDIGSGDGLECRWLDAAPAALHRDDIAAGSG